jgi:radical SAM superfamily enzyme YgiQ (UPF0313 family)
MKRRILMVYPAIPSTYWSYDHALPFVGRRSAIPPLGLMTVAALLPPSYEVRLVDLNVATLTEADVLAADLVFISAMLVQSASFAEVVKMCNECGKPVVAGGPYPISSHEQIQGVDHFVLDEAELTLPAFLADLESGSPQRLYSSSQKPDISRTPPPRFDLIDVSAYDSMPLQYSRGCPFECEFCDIIEMFGRTQRTKDPEQFVAELQAVYATGFRGSLFIVDDNFVGNRRKTKTLLSHIVAWQRERGFPFVLSTEASIDMAADDELLDLMVQAGFTMAFVGIETPDVQTLAYTQKAQNTRTDLMASVRKIQARGIEVTAGFILGFDTDDEGVFDRQIAFIQEAAIPVAMVGLLMALPNTALHRRLHREGRLLGDSSGNNTHTLSLNFTPRLPEEVLVAGYKRVLSEIYSPSLYFERCTALIDRMPAPSRRGGRVGPREIRALGLSLLRQSFSPYGLRYLRYLIHALRTKPRLFPTAVALAIKGHHFFTITGEIPRAEAFSRMVDRVERVLRERVRRVIARRKTATAVAMEARIESHLRRMVRRYGEFGEGMQRYMEQAFTRFVRRCETWIAMLRRMRLSTDQAS